MISEKHLKELRALYAKGERPLLTVSDRNEILDTAIALWKVYMAAEEVSTHPMFTPGSLSFMKLPAGIWGRMQDLQDALSIISAQLGDNNV